MKKIRDDIKMISVLMSTYKEEERLLRQAIESILNQTYTVLNISLYWIIQIMKCIKESFMSMLQGIIEFNFISMRRIWGLRIL